MSFRIDRGITTTICGTEGSGKTTLLRVLGGIVPVSSGLIQICELNISTNQKKIAEIIGYIPRINKSTDRVTIKEYLNWWAVFRQIPHPNNRVKQIMGLLNMENNSNIYLCNLDINFLRLVEFARSILHDPKIILIEEQSGVGSILENQFVLNVLRELMPGVTIVSSTRHLNNALRNSRMIIIIDKGKILIHDTPRKIKTYLMGLKTIIVQSRGDLRPLMQSISTLPYISDCHFSNFDSLEFLTTHENEAQSQIMRLANQLGCEITDFQILQFPLGIDLLNLSMEEPRKPD